MRILLVNDDGIHAEGIQVLAKVLSKENDVIIAAPTKEQSGMSQALTVGKPLCVKSETLDLDKVKKSYSIDGTPADCCKLALEILLEKKPDLVISGINNGANLGTDVLYSGTVGAALEAYNHNISSIAVSVPKDRDITMSEVALVMTKHIKYFYQPDKLFMYNINFPKALKNGKVKFVPTKQGYRRYENEFDVVKSEDNSIFYRMQGRAKDNGNDEFTDIAITNKGFISVTPLFTERTNFEKLDQLLKYGFNFN